MRRAIAAAALTVAGLIALLDYRSSTPATAPSAASPTTSSSSGSSTSGSSTSGSAGSGVATGSGSSTSTTSGSSTTASSAAKTATGELVTYQYGDIDVKVTVADGKVIAVSVPTNSSPDFRSEQINSEAVPQLTSEALSAGGASIDAVSGATYTSDAFIQSLQSALSRADA